MISFEDYIDNNIRSLISQWLTTVLTLIFLFREEKRQSVMTAKWKTWNNSVIIYFTEILAVLYLSLWKNKNKNRFRLDLLCLILISLTSRIQLSMIEKKKERDLKWHQDVKPNNKMYKIKTTKKRLSSKKKCINQDTKNTRLKEDVRPFVSCEMVHLPRGRRCNGRQKIFAEISPPASNAAAGSWGLPGELDPPLPIPPLLSFGLIVM